MVRLMLIVVCLVGILSFVAMSSGVLVALSDKPEPPAKAYTQEQVNALSRYCRLNGYRVTYRTERRLAGSRVKYVRCEAGTE